MLIEGGEVPTIDMWAEKIHSAAVRKPTLVNGNGNRETEQPDSRPPSSGLSSLGDREEPDIDMLDP